MNESGESPVRSLTDSGGQVWHVYVVIEGSKWDPEIEMRRRNWLCMESSLDRRFVSPVPDGWTQWNDAKMLTLISRANPDLRGP